MTELKASILSSDIIRQAMSNEVIAELITQVLIPKVVQERYPALTDDEVEQVRQQVVLSTSVQGSEIETAPDGKKFIRIVNQFVEIDKLLINLIDSINPFQRAYEILSRSITPEILRTVQFVIEEQRSDMMIEEAVILYRKYLLKYQAEHDGKLPTLNEADPLGRRIASAIAFIARKKQECLSQKH